MIANTSEPTDQAPPTVTTVEAAWLTELSPKTINATIDRGELGGVVRKRSSTTRARRLGTADVVYLVLRRELSDVLSAAAKRELYERLVELSNQRFDLRTTAELGRDCEIALAGGVVRVELKSAWRRLSKRWLALRKAADVVVFDPATRNGEPVVRGTRIPVHLIAELFAQGADLREILEDYPSLNASKVRSALAYAQTHPRRGRPRKGPWRS
ncbi:MAG TPA: DUF433 domain-containing protein [Gemmatimonadaceae bacterium]|nr:DUF433 domain-containing protein [Gemmatimonadaceae bacterium]